MIRKTVFLGLLAACLLSTEAYGQYSRTTPVVEAVEKVKDAVVNINSSSMQQGLMRMDSGLGFFNDFFPPLYSRRNYIAESLGTGVIVSEEGHIVTNAHVVSEPIGIQVTLVNGESYEAIYLGADSMADVAILKIVSDEKEKFPYLNLEPHDDLLIGETVIAVGNPYGLQNTVTTGVVSAVGRKIQTDKATEFSGIIQTDAAINPGNSGGPLLNINGELIGICVAVQAQANNIGFAIPSSKVLRAFNELVRGFTCLQDLLGVDSQNISPALARHLGIQMTEGVIIVDVIPGTLGDFIGLQVGDILTNCADRPIADNESFCKVLNLLDEEMPDELLFCVRRGDNDMMLRVDAETIEQYRERRFSTAWRGMRVMSISGQAARRLGVRMSDGVIIDSVEKNSPAEKAGLNKSDLIRQIGKERIASLADFQRVIATMDKYNTVELLFLRNGNTYVAKISQ